MEEIIKLFERYKKNQESIIHVSTELVGFYNQEDWTEFYKQVVQTRINEFQENASIFTMLDQLLARSFSHEEMEILYEQLIALYQCEVRDYLFFTKVLDVLLPYYENSEDLSKKIWLYSIAAYEINEIKRRQLSSRTMDFYYYNKIIELGKEHYTEITEKKDRLRIWIAYYNKCCGGLNHYCISVRDAFDCSRDMKNLWNDQKVQELDGKDPDFIGMIKTVRINLIESVFSLDINEKDLCERFQVAVSELYGEEIRLVKSEYELAPLVYTGHLFVQYSLKKSDINQVFDQFMDYFHYHCIKYYQEESLSQEAVDFYTISVTILSRWAKLGVDDEKIRKMVGSFIVLAEKRWRFVSPSVWADLNRLMKNLCYQIMLYGSAEINTEQCLINMVLSRDFNLYVHSKFVEKISVLIGEALYEKKLDLFVNFQDFKKNELMERISISALLHDCGKTDMYEVIYLNERPWTDEEIDYIETHPNRGGWYMSQFADLKQYEDVVRGHHKSYDGKSGYPAEFDPSASDNRILTDIIHIADDIEFEMGRYYREGIAFVTSRVVSKLRDGRGTEYHPEIVDVILNDQKLLEQIASYMGTDHYDELFVFLRGIQNGSIHQNFDEYLKDVILKYREVSVSGNYDEYKPYLDKLFEIAARENTNRGFGIAYYYMLRYHFLKKDYMNATNYCHEAIRYLENTEEYFYLCVSYNLLGVLMEFQGNAENGIGYFLKSVDYGKRCEKNQENLGTAYNNIANLFKNSKNYERALYYYEMAETQLSEYKESLICVLCNKLYCYVCLKDQTSVISTKAELEKLRKEIGYEDFDLHVYLSYANRFLGRMGEMEVELLKAKNDLTFLNDYIMFVSEIYVYLDLLEALGRFEEMVAELEKYIHYFEHVQINNQIFGKMVQRRIKCGHMMQDMKSVGFYGKYLYQNAERNKKFRAESALQIEKAYLENIRVQRKQREIIKENQKLEKAVQEAKQANAAKSTFLTSMSHEIRTPIHAILGLDEMILRECKDEAILQYATDIQNAGKTLVGIISDVLDISKMESGKMEIIPEHYQLVDLVQELRNMIESRAKDKGLDFQITCDKSIPRGLYGDDLRIKQVILNILTNAVKYTKEGSVLFSIAYEKNDAEHILLKVSVKDTGMGMKKEDLERLSTPFVRFDGDKNKNIEGTGLGMNIVKNLVKEMNGVWKVESEYGKGSEFFVEIPQTVVDWTELGDVFEKRKASVADKKTALFTAPNAEFLVVDDNAVNLKVVSSLLKRTKVKVTCVMSGKECLALCEEKKYDMILLDHRMPELDGVETLALLKQMKGLNSDTPVIALTANAVSGAADYYKEKGFDELVTKPVDHVEMERKIKNLLPPELVE